MRQLTAKQKKILDKFIKDQQVIDELEALFNDNAPFKGGKYSLDADDLPNEIYAELEKINDTEILYQEVNRYLEDQSSEILHKR